MRKHREIYLHSIRYPCSVFEHLCSVSKQKPRDYPPWYISLKKFLTQRISFVKKVYTAITLGFFFILNWPSQILHLNKSYFYNTEIHVVHLLFI